MNNQQVSHALTFYRINFDFHDPYKFVLDGNFIKLIVQKQVDFKRRLENVINGKIKFYVPSCLLRELQLLGSDFKIVLQKAKEFRKISCKHALQVSVDQCIVQNLVGEDNPEKYIICTQDIDLRRILREVINCPLMYFGPDQRIKFQDVHKKNIALIQKQAKQKLLPKQNQMGQINEYKRQMARKEKEQDRRQKLKNASILGVKLKDKIAKGPNPLSIRKRKIRPHEVSSSNHKRIEQQVDQEVEETVDAGNSKKKRIRKKKSKTAHNANHNNPGGYQDEAN